MMKKLIRITTLFLGLILLFPQLNSAQTAPVTTAIKIGEAAPPLKYSDWLKGKPVDRFEKGKIYVLEFWATWCHFCIEAMPHLSELAARYNKDVTFIGVDVFETTPYQQDPILYNRPKVKNFITTGMGKVMTYSLARDDKDGYMAKNWVSGQSLYQQGATGIPFTAIVGRDGNIAWLGHPVVDGAFEKALDEVVKGTFDVQAFKAACAQKLAAVQQAQKEAVAKRVNAAADPLLKPMNDAIANENYGMAITEAYKAIGQKAALARPSYLPRLNAYIQLLTTDPELSYDLIQLEKSRIKMVQDTAQLFLKDLAGKYGIQPGLPKKHYEFVVQTLQQEPAKRVETIRYLKGLAWAYYQLGNKDLAVKIVQNMIEHAKARGTDPPELEKILKEFTVGQG